VPGLAYVYDHDYGDYVEYNGTPGDHYLHHHSYIDNDGTRRYKLHHHGADSDDHDPGAHTARDRILPASVALDRWFGVDTRDTDTVGDEEV
jgi:hypothetical protein